MENYNISFNQNKNTEALNFFNSAGDKTFNRVSSASLSNENAFCGEAPFEVIYSAFLYVE